MTTFGTGSERSSEQADYTPACPETSYRGSLERIEAALKDARALLNLVGPDTTPGQIGKVTVSIEHALRDLEHLKEVVGNDWIGRSDGSTEYLGLTRMGMKARKRGL